MSSAWGLFFFFLGPRLFNGEGLSLDSSVTSAAVKEDVMVSSKPNESVNDSSSDIVGLVVNKR